MHVGFVDLDIAEMDRRVALDDAVGSCLAHDLGIDDGILGHVDDEVALDGGRTGEAAAFGQAADAVVALFLGADGGDVVVGRGDAVFGELAFLDLDLAAPAGGAAAADALDIDAERAGRLEHRSADGEMATLAGGHEEDEGICGLGHQGLSKSGVFPGA